MHFSCKICRGLLEKYYLSLDNKIGSLGNLQKDAINSNSGGGRKRLPKFKFSAKFPIGLHVILQIQIKKFENDCYIM